MDARETAKRFAVGVEIYYTGDMANCEGFGRIERVSPPDRWNALRTVDITLEDGRHMQGVLPHNFGRGRGGHRFVFRSDYDEDRAEQIRAFEEWSTKYQK